MLVILLVASVQGAWGIEGEWKHYVAEGYASGSGTKNEPYIIKTAEELAYLAYDVSNNKNASLKKYYALGADIDLGAHYWMVTDMVFVV